MNPTSTIHASAVLVGAKAVLIRGPSGSGKSRLAWDLIEAARSGVLLFARLVADDRASVEALAGRLLVRPASALAGLIEIRGLGIRRIEHEPLAVVSLVVDLAAADGARFAPPEAQKTVIAGIRVLRLAVAPGTDPLPPVMAVLRTRPN